MLQRVKWQWALVGLVPAVLSGCGGTGDLTDEDLSSNIGAKPGETAAPEGFTKADAGAVKDTVAEVQSGAVDNTYAVGVMPGDGHTCPSDSPLVSFYMDDEDDDNRSFGAYWHLPQTQRAPVPSVTNRAGTTLRFCKVNGQSFKYFTLDVNAKAYFYAVLKLGQYCPNGSLEMARGIDNEDDDNANSSSGPIAPNVSDRNGTVLRFCFFRNGWPFMSSFPDIGISYSVFHDYDGAQPAQFPLKGWIFSDDEDHINTNWISPSGTSEAIDFAAIVGGGINTMMDISLVR